MVICISLYLQRPCSHFPSLFSAIINQWPSARDRIAMNASTTCSFLRHPGKWLSLAANPKTIYSNAMDWSTDHCRSSASPRHRVSVLCKPGPEHCSVGLCYGRGHGCLTLIILFVWQRGSTSILSA